MSLPLNKRSPRAGLRELKPVLTIHSVVSSDLKPRSRNPAHLGIRATEPMLAIPVLHTDQDNKTDSARAAHVGPFQDIPRRIWVIFLSAWAVLFSLMVVFFAVDGASAFAVTIVVLIGLMAFGLPVAMAAQSKCEKNQCTGIIDTHTGPVSVGAAGAQIALIPIAAVIGLTAFILLAM